MNSRMNAELYKCVKIYSYLHKVEMSECRIALFACNMQNKINVGHTFQIDDCL